MGRIDFFTVDTGYVVRNKKKIKEAIPVILKKERIPDFEYINIIICSDDYLLNINRKYLNHNFLTDIITFNYSSSDKIPEAELYISIDRVKENGRNLGIPARIELFRVIIHGILHLCGYHDKRKSEKQKMHALESRYLHLME